MDKRTFISEVEDEVLEILKKIKKTYKNIGIAIAKSDNSLLLSAIDFQKEFNIIYFEIYEDIAFAMTAFSLLANDFRRCIGLVLILERLKKILIETKTLCRLGLKESKREKHLDLVIPLLLQINKKIKKLIFLFENKNSEEIILLAQHDKNFDSLYKKQFLKAVSIAKYSSSRTEIENVMDVCNVLNQFERIGNSIVNICQDLIYIIKGKHYDLTK